jgi:hypothetical protein
MIVQSLMVYISKSSSSNGTKSPKETSQKRKTNRERTRQRNRSEIEAGGEEWWRRRAGAGGRGGGVGIGCQVCRLYRERAAAGLQTLAARDLSLSICGSHEIHWASFPSLWRPTAFYDDSDFDGPLLHQIIFGFLVY